MAELNNCLLPDDLLYHVEYNVWVRQNDDGTCEVGMTDVAQSMAGSIIHCRPKKVGKKVKLGKSLATVESGKWVGPVKSPFAGEVVASNDAAVADATILNRSPYKEGWIVKLTPADGEALAGLLSGQAAVDAFATYMADNDLAECIHCEGFDG